MDSAKLFPPQHRDACTLAGLRGNFKFMRKTFGPAETKPHSVSGRVAISQSQIDILNSGAPIFEDQPYAGPPVIFHDFDDNGSTSAIVEGVARQFTRCGDYLRLIHQPESD